LLAVFSRFGSTHLILASDALDIVLEQTAILLRLQELGAVKICTTVNELRASFGSGQLAAILHMEGCEAIDNNFHALDVLHAAGLRSLGPVWSRSTIFGHGVPFRFPSTPDIGTHSNAHALCAHARNLTDEQLEIIKASKGLVGLNYAAAFLRADGRMLPDVPIRQMLKQLQKHGYGENLIRKLCHNNWFDVLERTWSA